MTQVMRITHDANNWNEYDSNTEGDHLSLASSAGLNGSAYGISIHPGNGSSAGSASYDLTGITVEDAIRTTFYVDINTLTISSSGVLNVFELKSVSSGNFLTLKFVEDSGEIKMRMSAVGVSDQDITVPQSSVFFVKTLFVKASGSGVEDGVFTVWVDSVQKVHLTDVNNYSVLNNVAMGEFLINTFQVSYPTYTGSIYIDEWTIKATITQDYDLVISGNTTSPAAVSADGNYIYFALEEDVSSNQVVVREPRPPDTGDPSSPDTAYAPGGGTSGNVYRPSDTDKMIFTGNFGTNVGVIQHAITANSNTDISPASIGAKKMMPASVDPSDADHIVVINSDDQDAIETTDSGSNWSTLNAALGQTVEAMDIVYLGQHLPFSAFFGGDDATDTNLEYTPNEFANLREDTSASLQSANAITGIAIVVDNGN